MTIATASLHLVAVDKTAQAFRSAQDNVKKLEGAFISLKGALLSVVGIAGFDLLIEKITHAGSKIHDLSIRLGASTEALSQYQHVAAQAGVSFDDLTKSWETLQKNSVMAAAGLGKAKRAFAALFTQEQLEAFKKLKPEEQFETLVVALNKVKNPAERLTLAMMAMGDKGAAAMQIIGGGIDKLKKAREEADKFGMTLHKASAAKLKQASEALEEIHTAVQGLATAFTVALAPAITAGAHALIH